MDKTINKRKSSPVKGLNSSPQSPNTFIDLLDADCVSFRFQNKSHLKKKKRPLCSSRINSPLQTAACRVPAVLTLSCQEATEPRKGVQTPACPHAFYF